jgi:NADH dehydrogenase
LCADAGNAPSRFLRSRGEGEAALRVHSGKEVAFTIFQPSVVFGPDDTFINRFAKLLRLVPLAFPLACPSARLQPVAVGDVASAFVRAMDDPTTIGKRYALCGPRVYTLRELVSMIRDELALHRWVFGLPDPLARMQGAVMQWLPGAPFSLDNFHSLQIDSVCKAGDDGLRALGIAPTPLALALPAILHGRR